MISNDSCEDDMRGYMELYSLISDSLQLFIRVPSLFLLAPLAQHTLSPAFLQTRYPVDTVAWLRQQLSLICLDAFHYPCEKRFIIFSQLPQGLETHLWPIRPKKISPESFPPERGKVLVY